MFNKFPPVAASYHKMLSPVAVKSAIVAASQKTCSVSPVGGSVSCIITSCVCVLEKPVESVKVQVMVVEAVMGSVVVVTPVIDPSQLSVAVGGVNADDHSHWAVSGVSEAKSGTGGVVSCIITSCVCVLEKPAESVKVQVMVVEAVMGSVVVVCPWTMPSQLSVAVGAVSVVYSHWAVSGVSEAESAKGGSETTVQSFNPKLAPPVTDDVIPSICVTPSSLPN